MEIGHWYLAGAVVGACIASACTTDNDGGQSVGGAGGTANGGNSGQAMAGSGLGGGRTNGGASGHAGGSEGGQSEGGESAAAGHPGGEGGGAWGCRDEYELASYDGDTSGLCAPEMSTGCACDRADAEAVECPPGVELGGEGCVRIGGYCEMSGEETECGWTLACSDARCLDSHPERSTPCAADDDCSVGKCTKRIADRMFCD